jgi:hypothetical protein
MPITEPLNPRAVPGSNEAPDYAQQVTDRIASEYAEITTPWTICWPRPARCPRRSRPTPTP